MEQGDTDSNSSASTESLADCNDMEYPYWNVPSVYPGTSDASTTSSDEAFYRDQLVQCLDPAQFVATDWADFWVKFPVTEDPLPDENATLMILKDQDPSERRTKTTIQGIS